MNTAESKKNQINQQSKPEQKSGVLTDNKLILAEERKYKILRQLRRRLGKSKEEFHKIFELYHNLVN